MDNLLPAARPFLLTVYENKEDADVAWEVMVSSRIYGLAFGCFVSIFMSRRHGRKFPVVLGSVLDLVGILLTLVTVHIRLGMVAATIGRFINGCGQGIVQTAGSVMLAELPPTQKRGIALATLTVWACLGELAGMVISLEEFLGKPTTWHIAMGVPLIPLIPALYILARAPESPRYLFLENREDEARKALLFYQKGDNIDENGNRKKSEKTANTEGDKSTLAFAKERFKNGQFIRPLLLALFVQSFVHLDDWLWISYSTHIFGKFGMTMGTAQRASLFMSLPQAVISIALLACFENFTRRSLLLVPTAFSVLIGIFAIIAVNFGRGAYISEKVIHGRIWGISVLGGIPIASTLAILASMDLSAAAISGESAYAIVPELFLPNDKILGTAIVGIAQNVFGGILTAVLLTAVNKAGTTLVLIPFILMNILYVAINYQYLPETSQKTAHRTFYNFWKDHRGPPNPSTILFQVLVLIVQVVVVVLTFQAGLHLYWAIVNYLL
ncbi:transporter, major facilitator family protein [Ancylostoma ceylanicum]|uniref:Transporter, major facilitator family protein n=1 Tax=Ancylostoma ceylanicum TaxID=53326 RepID=A0A0D6MA34_9BILA|nr:transporter, major facilitator family protein [Ancylostoma ceylanicum]